MGSPDVGHYAMGRLRTVPVAQRPGLVPAAVYAALAAAHLLDRTGVVAIDPALSDTAETTAANGLECLRLGNCVLIIGRREGLEKIAACVVLSTTRADVNSTARRWLGVRKASFLSREEAVTRSGMEFGAITPVGLPDDWSVLIDEAVAGPELVLIGSGYRASKLVLPGAALLALSTAELVTGLGRTVDDR